MPSKNPTAPPLYPNLNNDGTTFRLTEIRKIRDFLETEVNTRGRVRRSHKRAYNAFYYVNSGAGITAACSTTASIILASTGIGALGAIPLGSVAIVTGVVSVASSKICKIILRKLQKHERIENIAMAKLSSIDSLVSKALKDNRVSDEEFNVILQEMDSYRELKSQIKRKIRKELSLSKEQGEQIRQEAEKNGIQKGRELMMTDLHRTITDQTSTT